MGPLCSRADLEGPCDEPLGTYMGFDVCLDGAKEKPLSSKLGFRVYGWACGKLLHKPNLTRVSPSTPFQRISIKIFKRLKEFKENNSFAKGYSLQTPRARISPLSHKLMSAEIALKLNLSK